MSSPAPAVTRSAAIANIPDDLKERDQWVLWRIVRSDSGRVTKRPFRAGGEFASSTDPSTWDTFEAVAEAHASGAFDGIGFVFSDVDPFCGIDLDNCLTESGELKEWAQRTVARFCDTYMEVSPSRCGIKIFCRGSLPGTGHRKQHKDGAVEIYDRGRFFTVTGEPWRGAPAEIEEHQADVGVIHEWAEQAGSSSRRKYSLKDFPKVRAKQSEGDASRHEFLKTQAARLRNLGMQLPELVTALKAINQEHCEPPKPDREVEELARYFAGMESRAEVIEMRRSVRTPQPRQQPTQVTSAVPISEAAADAENAQARRSSRAGRATEWHQDLICKSKVDSNGNESLVPVPCLANAVTMLRGAPGMAGCLAFDEFSLDIVATEPTPWGSTGKWTDNDNTCAAVWLQREHLLMVNSGVAAEAAQKVAREQSFHPVRDYLESLRWDGTGRIGQWLTLYLGAANGEYTRAIGERWLISAVARVFRPGAKADCCLVLEGQQGLRKSTALRTLAGSWFTDEIAELGSKDAAMQTRGVWIIEFAELASIRKSSDIDRIKGFMSRSVDRFRPPYGRTLVDSPRQCVFAGSVNPGGTGYLHDETGSRRFWPVECTSIKIDELARDRDQLWAEAVARFKDGAPWWLDTKELNDLAEEQQEERYEGGQWDDLIRRWLQNPTQRWDKSGPASTPIEPFTSTCDSTTIDEVLLHCIGKPEDRWTQADRTQVAKCLRAAKWNRRKVGPRDQRQWRYERGK